MIGADTNVVVRLLVDDQPEQARAARALANAAERLDDPILLTPLVLAETEWVLRRSYRFSKQQRLAALDSFCSDAGVVIDDRNAVEAAIEAWRSGSAGFADYLIAALARERGARTTMTFDQKAAKTAAFTLLPS